MTMSPVTARPMTNPTRKSATRRIVKCEFAGSFFALSQVPKDPRPQIAFAGRSNVGKSTLLNGLIGRRKLAQVSRTPGKTRSLNFYLVNDSYFFVDLPGYGYARVAKEVSRHWRVLIEGYLTQSTHLIGLILLLDCRRELTADDLQLVAWLSSRSLPVLAVVTKSDKLGRDRVGRRVAAVQAQLGTDAIAFSALTGVGRHELFDAIVGLLATSTARRKEIHAEK
ncbi:MAG TPA: ribosome biogenesis GTP-binding protein YihA/YsxC [Candidatus Deferrimicrobium sp.]|nr:ribosome biogenesis GTP-binding protein YihA/YsxC [Candidatus Deferrimicrobium sp.]